MLVQPADRLRHLGFIDHEGNVNFRRTLRNHAHVDVADGVEDLRGHAALPPDIVTNQAHNNCPIMVTIKTFNQELRLRLIKPGNTLLTPHKIRRLLFIPSSLRFIKFSIILKDRWSLLWVAVKYRLNSIS